MIITDRLDPYCFPTDLNFDVKKLIDSVEILFSRLGISHDIFNNELLSRTATTFNLNHLPGIEGIDRWQKHRGSHNTVEKANIKEEDFSEFLTELDGLYLKEAIDNVFKMHNSKFEKPFQGRCQLIWLRANHAYRLHRDMHTAHRYHIPLITDENCLWVFENKHRDMSLCHMPADGRVWYLNPRDIKHSVFHMGTQTRMHILLTTGN